MKMRISLRALLLLTVTVCTHAVAVKTGLSVYGETEHGSNSNREGPNGADAKAIIKGKIRADAWIT